MVRMIMMAKRYSGYHVGLKLADIVLQVRKSRKNFTQETCPDRESNPGPLLNRHACYLLSHSGGLTSIFINK